MAYGRIAYVVAAAAALALYTPGPAARAQETNQSQSTAAPFSFDALDGGKISLGAYIGKPVLVVNTASQCGFAGQLGDMTELWTRYHDRGLMIVAVPTNDFRQEPGDPALIRRSAENYKAQYPFTAMQTITGASAHPFFRWAARAKPNETPKWNFHKYLIGADGQLAASFPTSVRPTDPEVTAAIERELAAGSRASR